MKTKLTLCVAAYVLSLSITSAQTNTFPSTGAAGIGTTSPNASSLLEINSTTKGLLISRMTKNQRDAITSPATGLLIYQTNGASGFYYYDGSKWAAIIPKAKGWNLTGNAETNPSSNFIGTTDAQSLAFKVNNTGAGLLDYNGSTANTSFGFQSLAANTGTWNTAFGYVAMVSNSSGSYNAAFGRSALADNTIGNYNTAMGQAALVDNISGSENTAIG